MIAQKMPEVYGHVHLGLESSWTSFSGEFSMRNKNEEDDGFR